MDLRGMTVEKLADLSDIPERYLKALEGGDFKNLPPSPYARGYLMKIALILNVDGELLWQIYKKKTSQKFPDLLIVCRQTVSLFRHPKKNLSSWESPLFCYNLFRVEVG